MIQHSMEWLFWPMGFNPTAPVQLASGEIIQVPIPWDKAIQRGLAARFKVTNYEAWMAALREHGAIREQKR